MGFEFVSKDVDADMQCGEFDVNKYLFADNQLSLDGKRIVDTFVGCIKKAKSVTTKQPPL